MTSEIKNTYWSIINKGYINYPILNQNEKCDVVVIGGGISGCLTAYLLSQYNLNTILIDKSFIAGGGTYNSIGVLENKTDFSLNTLAELIGEKKAIRAEKLCKKAVDTLENVLYHINHPHIFQRKDFEYIYKDSGKELSRNCGIIDPFKLCHVLLKASLKKNARVYENTSAVGYDYYSNNIRVNIGNSNYIECKKIIFTDVSSSYKLIKEWELLEFRHSYTIITDSLEDTATNYMKKHLILKEDEDLYTYIRPTCDKRLMISEFNGGSQPDKNSKLLHKLENILSFSQNLRVEYSLEKIYGQSPDGLPYIGEHPKFNDCYFNLALGRNHICYSLIGAEIIKDLILYESNPDAEIFSFERN
ncbi:FAD-dependent oxidoreductase [Clostridium bovifaecis]|uniref:FAD-dependent oxidoreductase n=1 Tax=Clostridium bovifaecis TaxID=2184719 RepID=A0A6I6F6J8_9CLOT|nr:FAD-dependent oxidoreductase [Clostridium bovifaecis]